MNNLGKFTKARNSQGPSSNSIEVRFAGVELYFDDLKKARKFYAETLGLKIS